MRRSADRSPAARGILEPTPDGPTMRSRGFGFSCPCSCFRDALDMRRADTARTTTHAERMTVISERLERAMRA